MANFQDRTIKEVVEKINDTYFLPDIQREYVWLNNPRERKIENLFDSIMRGYPIGTFLIWRRKKSDLKDDSFAIYEFTTRYNASEPYAKRILNTQLNRETIDLVLDGQQRLTSLYIALKGDISVYRKYSWRKKQDLIQKALYLDLNYVPDFDDPDDSYCFDFLTADEAAQSSDGEHWFKVSSILDVKPLDYSRDNQLNTVAADTLQLLRDKVCINKGITLYEEEDRTLDEMLTIFIRVNSGGTQLSYSDLLMSILTASFKDDIRGEINNLVDAYKDAGFGRFGRDQLLKSMLVLNDLPSKFVVKNFNKKNVAIIEANWEENTRLIDEAIELMKGFGYSEMLYQSYIITTLAYWIKKRSKLASDDKKEMLRFAQLAQIQSYFSSATDTKLGVVTALIDGTDSFGDFNNKLAKADSYPLRLVSEDIDSLLNVKYGSSEAFPVLQLIYSDFDYLNKNFILTIFTRSRNLGRLISYCQKHIAIRRITYLTFSC